MTETGDRRAFLATARRRLAGGVHANSVHVPPPPTAVPPEVRFTALDRADLVGTFVAMATEVDAVVHRVAATDLTPRLVELAREHHATTVVRSVEPELEPLADALTEAGLTVDPYSPDLAAAADLGLTAAVAGIAATGSLVLDASVAGSRAVGLLPSGPRLCPPGGPTRRHPRRRPPAPERRGTVVARPGRRAEPDG